MDEGKYHFSATYDVEVMHYRLESSRMTGPYV